MKIIAVTNRKGGVGKTTMATHIAAGLATRGYNVALVDTDSQGHSGLMLGMPEENGLFNVLVKKQPIEDVVSLVPVAHYSTPDLPSEGNLYLLPSSNKTYQIPWELQQDEVFLFLETIEDLGAKANVDVVIIDTHPTLSMFDGAIYMAVDGFIYVTEAERLSFDGVQEAIMQMRRAGKRRKIYLNRDSRVLGIIPNKLRMNTVVHRINSSALAENFPDLVWHPVRLRTAWVEAANLSEMIYVYAPSGREAEDAWRVVSSTEEALQTWLTKKSD